MILFWVVPVLVGIHRSVCVLKVFHTEDESVLFIPVPPLGVCFHADQLRSDNQGQTHCEVGDSPPSTPCPWQHSCG